MIWKKVCQMPDKMQNEQHKKKQQKQSYRDYNLRRPKPKYLQLKAQEQLMGYPNATGNKFSSHNIQEDVMTHVSSNFLHDVEQIKTELAILRQEKRNIRVELQELRVSAMEGTSRAQAPIQRGNQKTARFCDYCHNNGHTLRCWRKKMRDEDLRRVQNYMSSNDNGPRTMALAISAVDLNAIQIWANFLIWMMKTAQKVLL